MCDHVSCYICGEDASSYHHIVYRSENKALIKSELNLIPLCDKCHSKIHSKDGEELNHKLRLKLQNDLEFLFMKNYLTEQDIKEILEINDNACKLLLKSLEQYKEGYKREDILLACMGHLIKEDI